MTQEEFEALLKIENKSLEVWKAKDFKWDNKERWMADIRDNTDPNNRRLFCGEMGGTPEEAVKKTMEYYYSEAGRNEMWWSLKAEVSTDLAQRLSNAPCK